MKEAGCPRVHSQDDMSQILNSSLSDSISHSLNHCAQIFVEFNLLLNYYLMLGRGDGMKARYNSQSFSK